jgi:hypothetical protein
LHWFRHRARRDDRHLADRLRIDEGTRKAYVIGGADRPEIHLPTGNWSPLQELETLRGQVLISDDGRLHAVVYDEQQVIHLIGYTSAAEIVRAVGSFRRVTEH